MLALIAIVNYRTGDLVADCLASLEPEVQAAAERWTDRGKVRVVVVDNASGDQSPDQIEKTIADRGGGSWATFRRLERNGGFAYGNNEAIRPALESTDPPKYVWLLNPDTLVRPGALTELIAFLDSHPEVGLAGSRLEDPDGTPQRSAFRFHSALGELDNGIRLGAISSLLKRHVVAPPPPESAQPIDWVAGASLLVRREVFEAIGLLDEKFFMYYEEVDFCRRAAEAGWSCWYVPASRVVHLVGQASGINQKQANKRRPAFWYESRRRYLLRHLGRAGTLAADVLFLAGLATFRLRRRLQRKPDPDPAHYLADSFRHSVLARGFQLD